MDSEPPAPFEATDPALVPLLLWWIATGPHGFGLHTSAEGKTWKTICP